MSGESGGTAEVGRTFRRWIIERAHPMRMGHIASSLSVVEILIALWDGALAARPPDDPERDRFILSKGHAALALYCALRWKGLIDETTFRSYCKDGSRLSEHPEPGVPGVELATGSLGMGLSVGCGRCLASARRGSPARTFVLMSDAECNAGQVWEAAQFAAHHRLSSLVGIVDLNGFQALGETRNVLAFDPVGTWRAFGWRVVEVDGHDVPALKRAFAPGTAADRPTLVAARTVLGKGVSFMERQLQWHYRSLSDDLAAKALEELASPA